MGPVPTPIQETIMKTLLASLVLASVATTAFAVPPNHPQPLLGEAHGTSTVLDHAASDRTVSENGFERTPLGEQIAEDGFDLTPQADRLADDGFDRTPLGRLIAEDGSDRTGLGRT
jgi:hypothetical protein